MTILSSFCISSLKSLSWRPWRTLAGCCLDGEVGEQAEKWGLPDALGGEGVWCPVSLLRLGEGHLRDPAVSPEEPAASFSTSLIYKDRCHATLREKRLFIFMRAFSQRERAFKMLSRAILNSLYFSESRNHGQKDSHRFYCIFLMKYDCFHWTKEVHASVLKYTLCTARSEWRCKSYWFFMKNWQNKVIFWEVSGKIDSTIVKSYAFLPCMAIRVWEADTELGHQKFQDFKPPAPEILLVFYNLMTQPCDWGNSNLLCMY